MVSKIVLSGNLSFLSLGDILQLIGSSGGTGMLRILSKYSPDPGIIYFSKGNIVNGATPAAEGLKAVYELFGWVEGEYEFIEGPVNIKKTVTASRMEIILDGLRLVDDGETKKIGPVSFEESEGESSNMPIIKGPMVDYTYVVNEESFDAGYKIVQENRFGNWIWVILEGIVDILKATPKGDLTVIKLGPGSFIGNVASFLFQENMRKATALAATSVQLGILDTQRMTQEFSSLSKELQQFLLSLDHRRNDVTEKTVKNYLSKYDVKKMIKGRKKLIPQGGKTKKLYKIRQGSILIVRESNKQMTPLVHLKSGDYTGFIPFLDIGHEPRNASAYSSKDLEVTPVNAQALYDEYEKIPLGLKNLVESIAAGVSVTSHTACGFSRK